MGWELTTMDQFVDELLEEGYSCDIALPRLPNRLKLEDIKALDKRVGEWTSRTLCTIESLHGGYLTA